MNFKSGFSLETTPDDVQATKKLWIEAKRGLKQKPDRLTNWTKLSNHLFFKKWKKFCFFQFWLGGGKVEGVFERKKERKKDVRAASFFLNKIFWSGGVHRERMKGEGKLWKFLSFSLSAFRFASCVGVIDLSFENPIPWMKKARPFANKKIFPALN